MAAKVQLARPTKIELARLKRRLKLAGRIQKIVKDRLSILVMEFMQTVRECATVKQRQLEEFNELFRAYSLTVGYHGYMSLEKILMKSEGQLKISTATRNVAGVRIPLFEIEKNETAHPPTESPLDSSPLTDRVESLAMRHIETLIELAELESSLALLGAEINKVKRINNALEYVVIPGLDVTIRYLTMKFEERDREETARLKYVKILIEKREAYAY